MAEARTQSNYYAATRGMATSLDKARTLAPLVLRGALGVIFVAHGLQKFLAMGATIQGFDAMGFSPGALFAPIVMFVELVGGALILLGLFTRPAAAVIFVTQLVALLFVHLPSGFFLDAAGPGKHGIEFVLMNSAALLALVFWGSGAIGIDQAFRHRHKKLETRRTTPEGHERAIVEGKDRATIEASSRPGTKI